MQEREDVRDHIVGFPDAVNRLQHTEIEVNEDLAILFIGICDNSEFSWKKFGVRL